MMQDFGFARKVFGEDFLYERHVNYLLKSLKKSTFGVPLEVAEAHRLSSLFFVVSGLDLLGALDTRLTPADKETIIQWIYSHQVDVNRILIPNDLIRTKDEIEPKQQGRNDTNVHHGDARCYNREQTRTLATALTLDDTKTNTCLPANNINDANINDNHTTSTHNNNHSDNNIHMSQSRLNNDLYHNNSSYHQNNNQQRFQQHNHHSQQPFNQRAKHIVLSKRVGHAGFRATSMINNDIPLDFGVLPMTYCAIATLVILGDDLKRVDKESILKGMRQLQSSDGSFMPTIFGGETDMRLVYCAAAVSHLLNDWSGMDKDNCASFIYKSLTHEGAFGQCPGAEAHGGSTFCAVASLKLMSKFDETLNEEEIDRLIRWCLMRFQNGFCGRPNKDEDTCYSFWIGACLVMLDHFHFVEQKNLLDFILMAQEERGGLAKVPDFYSDPIHTYLGFAGLTFIDDDLCSKRGVNLLKLDPTLNISARARAYLDRLNGVKRMDLTKQFGQEQQSDQQQNNNKCKQQQHHHLHLMSTTTVRDSGEQSAADDVDSGKEDDDGCEQDDDVLMMT